MYSIMLLIAVLSVALGIGMLVQPNMYKEILAAYASRPAVRMITSMILISVAFGMSQVEISAGLDGWVYYIFIIGILVEGLIGLVIPKTYRTLIQYFLQNVSVHTMGLFSILMGAFMCWLVLM